MNWEWWISIVSVGSIFLFIGYLLGQEGKIEFFDIAKEKIENILERGFEPSGNATVEKTETVRGVVEYAFVTLEDGTGISRKIITDDGHVYYIEKVPFKEFRSGEYYSIKGTTRLATALYGAGEILVLTPTE